MNTTFTITTQDKIKELENLIEKANIAYRTGNAIISDYEYDLLMDELKELNPHNNLLINTGFIDDADDRKQPLPMEMASMNKVKTYAELTKWMELKGIPKDTDLVLTPKYDGLSLCVIEAKGHAWTRGNGILGQRSDAHFKLLNKKGKNPAIPETIISFGEVILSRKKFKNYEEDYVNPRNMVSGLLNSKTPEDPLEDCDYIRYGVNTSASDKNIQLEVCNKLNTIQVPYKIVKITEVSEDYLKGLYEEWKQDYEIDGIILEVNDAKLRQALGRETSTQNPCYARAFKGSFEEVKETTIVQLDWQVSKHGLLKPVATVAPVKLDGATVKRCTLYNAKTVKALGLGVGAKILIKRSGQVIPFVVSVITKVNWVLPKGCPSCGELPEWNSRNVELVCNNPECTAKKLNRIIAFFELLEVKNVSEGVCKQLYEAGYNTLKKILDMTQSDMEALDGFGERKAEIVYTNIHEKLQNVVLSKLQHASGCFSILGSKKLKLLEHFKDTPTKLDIMSIEGFAEKSADAYLKGIADFNNFIKGLPITIKEEDAPISDKFKGMVVVFTGIRRPDLEDILIKNSGKVGNSVTKATTHLVMKEKGSGSKKEQSAIKLGAKIIEIEEFENLLKGEENESN
jgi:DNA ligase (NAD+)